MSEFRWLYAAFAIVFFGCIAYLVFAIDWTEPIFSSIENPIERGLAYVATAILFHAVIGGQSK